MGYDAIIIGAGLGGCAAGAVLAGAGKKVIILERMPFIGGRCSNDEKDGWRRDIGCHFIFGCEHGSFTEAAKRVGKEIKFYHPSNYQVMVKGSKFVFDGEKITIKGRGPDEIEVNVLALINEVAGMLPKELITLGINLITQVMPMVDAVAKPIVDYFDNVTMKSVLDSYFEWPIVRNFLEYFQMAGYCTPSHLTAVSELFRTVLGFLGEYKPGMNPLELMGYPIGGLGEIPRTLCAGITEHGGEVRTDVGVKRVIVEGGKAVGVETDKGEEFRAPVIISNAGIKETVKDLVGNDKFDAEYAKLIGDLVVGISGFTVRCHLDKKITDLELGFCLPCENIENYLHSLWDDLVQPDEPAPIMISCPSNMDPTCCPEGKQLVLGVGPSMLHLKAQDFDKMAQYTIDSLDMIIPGFKDHLEFHDILTPLTYAAFGEENAPIIGIAQSIGQVGDNRPSSKSPIEGLYYVGGEAGKNVAGVACDMAVNSGIICADYVLQNVMPAMA